MENVIVIELDNGFKKLVPNKGYKLFNKVNKQLYSEVITKTPDNFVAVRDEETEGE